MKQNLNCTRHDKGIYVIRNIINNYIYIGRSTSSIYGRCKTHASELSKNKSKHSALQRAVLKHGFQNFVFDIIMISDDCNYIMTIESMLIKIYKPEYNCSIPDDVGREAPNQNKKFDNEWKYKLGSYMRNNSHKPETLEKLTKLNKENSTKVIFDNGTEILKFSSIKDASKHFNVKRLNLQQCVNNIYKGYKFTFVSKQVNKVRLIKDDFILEFNSMGKCDKYLNMWRGATSTYNLKNKKIKGYTIQKI